ncbi:MAG TPA: RtcB family protein, partial [Afifellaceae bacterium]|nr:RtcB family protein [Afifellaceae bacterium]
MGTSGTTSSSNTNVRLITSDKSWIEGEAVRQLETTAGLDGIDWAVGLPDLHPGKGNPVGAAFVSRRKLFPALIGNDVGCAMSFWQSDLHARKLKLDRWAGKLQDLEAPWEGDREAGTPDDWCERHQLPEGRHNIALGTIGGGNHFAELQKVEEIRDMQAFAALGLDR